MCETVANPPLEDKSAYVLTEDMIDAAMTEQFSYQDDIESEEEEESSHSESLSADPDTRGSFNDENTDRSPNHEENSYDGESTSVVVIETGLDKSQSNEIDKTIGTSPEDVILGSNKSINSANIILNPDPVLENTKEQAQSDIHNGPAPVQNSGDEKNLPILKKILSDTRTVESIDLCDSDTETDNSEDNRSNTTEVETIDNELESVMESNFMAEVGMPLSRLEKHSNTSHDMEISPSKITVKSVSQISKSAFNNMSAKCDAETSTSELTPYGFTKANGPCNDSESALNSVYDYPVKGKEQVPTTTSNIHLNRIAVPHKTYVNNQGQKMKCVYVHKVNQNTLPVMINGSQTGGSKNVKYVVNPKPYNGPVKLSSIAALTNMIKQTPKPQTQNVHKPSKVFSLAPRLQKFPPDVAPPCSFQFQKDQNHDMLVKELLFHNLKKPYVPSQVAPMTITYGCMDCSDRFVIESSLSQHLDRRSINIRYWCKICQIELQFFNRCTLLKHLRSHNTSIKNLETACVALSPLPKEMIDNGIATTFLKDSARPVPEKLVKKTKNVISTNDESLNTMVSSASRDKLLITNGTSISNTINTSVPGQSKSLGFQKQASAVLNKPLIKLLPAEPPGKSAHTMGNSLVKNPRVSINYVQTLQKQSNDKNTNNTSTQRSLILLCNKLPEKTTVMGKIPPNVVCESESRHVGEQMYNSILIDDDKQQNKMGDEEEEIDVENIAHENENCVSKAPELPFQAESSKQILPITKNTSKQKNGLNSSKSLGFRKPCSECGASCLNISKHLNGSNRPINPSFTCGICNLIMPTKCSLKIHLRIHLRSPPYSCPDCGKDFVSWDEVHAHLKFSCGHLAKCVRYLCTSCKAHFPSKSVLGHHISSKHARDVYRCPDCNIAFYHKTSLDKHIINNHQSEPGMAIECKQCSLCPKKLVAKDKVHKHIEEHLNSNVIYIYGYKCPICSIVYANKMAFIIHQIKEKNELDKKDGKKEKKKKTSHFNKLGDTICQTIDEVMEVEEEPEIVKKIPSPYDCMSNEKDPLSLEGWDGSQDQRVQEQREECCIVCKKNSVVILPGISLNDQSLCCKQCVRPLDGVSIDTKLHFRESNNLDHIKSKSTVNTTYSKYGDAKPKKRKRSNGSLIDGSTESDMSVEMNVDVYPIKKKNRKKGSKYKLGHIGQEARIQGKVITSNLPNDLTCAKCKFVATTKELFLEHITTHRTDPGDYQCLECGLCFVVMPSFEKHLQIHHDVRDVNEYIRDNTSCLPQKSVTLEEEADDNQCRICHMRFDSLSTLEKHFRTHGMAFMNSLSKSP